MTRPTAAPAQWPYTGHRNMQQVMADEAPKPKPLFTLREHGRYVRRAGA